MVEFKRWKVNEEDLANLTPAKARDLIIKCFFEAQAETISRAKQDLGKTASLDEVMKSVESIIRLTFKEVGCNFENPSKMELGKVVETLAKKADAWGTPPDIIEHHKGQIMNILKVLK